MLGVALRVVVRATAAFAVSRFVLGVVRVL